MSSLLGIRLYVIFGFLWSVWYYVAGAGHGECCVVHNALLVWSGLKGGCSFPHRNMTDCRSLHWLVLIIEATRLRWLTHGVMSYMFCITRYGNLFQTEHWSWHLSHGVNAKDKFFLLVGSPWQSDLSCALDVGRELSRLHSLSGAEANSMPSLIINTMLIIFCMFLVVVNEFISRSCMCGWTGHWVIVMSGSSLAGDKILINNLSAIFH